jgi:hypothetical protein
MFIVRAAVTRIASARSDMGVSRHMPLLAELVVPGGAGAINMSVLTDLGRQVRDRATRAWKF